MSNYQYSEDDKLMIVNEVVRRIIDNEESINYILADKSNKIKFPSSSTYYKWLRDNEKLAEIHAQGLIIQSDVLDDKKLHIALDRSRDMYNDGKALRPNNAAVSRDDLIIKTINTIQGNRQPKKYGSKVDVTSDGEQIIPQINIGNLDLSAIKGLKK